MLTPSAGLSWGNHAAHSPHLCRYHPFPVQILALSWGNFADYSVDELFPISSIGPSSRCCENRFSTEERAKFQQGNLKIYIQGLCHHYSLLVEVPLALYHLPHFALVEVYHR
jgi:hypothetical protein